MINLPSNRYKSYKINISDLKIIVYLDPTFKTVNNSPNNSILQSAKQLHFHLEHEIFFLTNGDLKVFYDNSFHVYNEGIVIIPSITPHFSISAQANHRLLIKIENEKSHLYEQVIKYFRPDNISQLQLNENITLYLTKLDNALNKPGTQHEEISSLLTLLFIEILDLLNVEYQKAKDVDSNQYVLLIDHIINSEFDKNINMKYLSNKLFLSTRQIARIIKKNYNCSLSQLIVQKKLSVACLILTKTNLPISKIITYINFETPNYFYTLFKKTYGLTPLQYRKKNKTLPTN